MSPGFVFLLILLLVIANAVTILIRRRFTRYQFREGFLIVNRGILFRSEKVFELVHLKEPQISRGPFDVLTQNGRLVLLFDQQAVSLRGLASIDELRSIRDRLMNVRRLLRNHPLSKGITTT